MPKRNLLWMAALVALALLAVWVNRASPPAVVGDPDHPLVGAREAYEEIVRRSGQAVADRLQGGAIEGMVRAIDEHSSFVPSDQVQRFTARMDGQGQGLGMALERRGPLAVIGEVRRGSPAWAAHLERGDVLVEVAGRDGSYLKPEELSDLLDAQPLGRTVRLTVLRRRGSRVESLELTTAQFAIESVEGLYRQADGQWAHQLSPAGSVAYVRVREFLPRTAQDVLMALRRQGRLEGLVLDLRGNPGGMLSSAVDVANLFLSEGLIVSVQDAQGGTHDYYARSNGTLPGELTVVVLVDQGTASAAEVVAGALRGNARALLVGQPTRGKDCLQSMVPLPMGQGNLTTGRLVLPQPAGATSPATAPSRSLPLAVDVREQVMPANRLALYKLCLLCENPPATGDQANEDLATRPSTPQGLVGRRLELDAPLAAAAALLEEPQRVRELLEAGRSARQEADRPRR